jgi:hypothetical protein
VTVWDSNGNTATSTEVAYFEMGLLKTSDWLGTWIARNEQYPPPEPSMYDDNPCPMLRHKFTIDTQRTIRTAKLYISGLGMTSEAPVFLWALPIIINFKQIVNRIL